MMIGTIMMEMDARLAAKLNNTGLVMEMIQTFVQFLVVVQTIKDFMNVEMET